MAAADLWLYCWWLGNVEQLGVGAGSSTGAVIRQLLTLAWHVLC